MTKHFFTILLLVALVTIAGCKKASTPTQSVAQQTPTTATAPEQYHHPEGGSVPAAETKYFKGSIGSSLGLQMKLVRNGDQISGNYFYQKVGTKIDLRGSVDKEGNLLLDEFDAGGKQTGSFKGIWRPDPEDGLTSIAGNWSKPSADKGSDKKTAFSVHEEPIAFGGGVELIAKQIKENNKKLNYEVAVEYPQLTGSTNPNAEKFNQASRSSVTKKIGVFKAEMTAPEAEELPGESMGSDINIGYTVGLAQDDLVSVRFEVGSYYRGAAHPNSYSEVLNFDLKNGKALKLSDLFKPGAKYLQAISSYCIKDLKRQSKAKGADGGLEDSSIESGAAPSAKNYQSWTIKKKGLGINFDSYQVGPYAAGPQYVLVPYATIKDLVNVDGPIGQFVK
jgi:hypothetical protein